MQISFVPVSEVDATIRREEEITFLRQELKRLFNEAELIRERLMWYENPTGETISWDTLREELEITWAK